MKKKIETIYEKALANIHYTKRGGTFNFKLGNPAMRKLEKTIKKYNSAVIIGVKGKPLKPTAGHTFTIQSKSYNYRNI